MQALIAPTVVSTLIGPADPKWTRFLGNTRHDFYHLPSYVRMTSKFECAAPIAFYAEAGQSSLLLPLLIRPIPEHLGFPKTWCDAVSPYGYPGPLINNVDDPETVQLLLRAFRRYALQNDIISVFIRLHPLLNETPEIFSELGEIVRHGETVCIDLRKRVDEIWRDLKHGHREGMRKLRRMRFTVEFDSWDRMDDFIHAYQSTMERVSAADFYRFPKSYFHELRQAVGHQLHVCSVQAPDDEFAAGGLFTLVNGIAQDHLAATNDKYVRLGPSKLMTYAQVIWLKSAGATVYHLGGGVSSRADSLFYFKSGFSQLRCSFSTCSAVIDEGRYTQLVSAASGRIGPREGYFFPAYR
jgi:Acetyltransferase (GNAT) domain